MATFNSNITIKVNAQKNIQETGTNTNTVPTGCYWILQFMCSGTNGTVNINSRGAHNVVTSFVAATNQWSQPYYFGPGAALVFTANSDTITAIGVEYINTP